MLRKILVTFAVTFTLSVATFLLWLSLAEVPSFSRPAVDLQASSDPTVIARGAYVVRHVAHCGQCHGEDLGGGPVKAVPYGRFYPGNLTPDDETGLGQVPDAQIARVLRHALAPDGRLVPFMKIAGPLADEDIVAVLSYLRTLPPVRRAVPDDEPNLAGRGLLQLSLGPKRRQAPPYVPPSDEPSAARGRYLAEGPASCVVCHTEYNPFDDLHWVVPKFSGGTPAPGKAGTFIPPNITKGGVLAGFDEDAFVARFRAGDALPGSPMPWTSFAGMTEADVRSLYRFLSSLPPAERDPGPRFSPAG